MTHKGPNVEAINTEKQHYTLICRVICVRLYNRSLIHRLMVLPGFNPDLNISEMASQLMPRRTYGKNNMRTFCGRRRVQTWFWLTRVRLEDNLVLPVGTWRKNTMGTWMLCETFWWVTRFEWRIPYRWRHKCRRERKYPQSFPFSWRLSMSRL